MSDPVIISNAVYKAAKKQGVILKENEDGTIHIGKGEVYYVCVVQKPIPPTLQHKDKDNA